MKKVACIVIVLAVLLVGCDEECLHVWKAGASFEKAKSVDCSNMISPHYYYTCAKCEVVTARSYENQISTKAVNEPNKVVWVFKDVTVATDIDFNDCSGDFIITDEVTSGEFILSDTNAPDIRDINTPGDLTTSNGDAVVWYTFETMESTSLLFEQGGVEVVFEWGDGKFNVVYDANNLSQSAAVFFDYIEPYINDHIAEKAEKLAKAKTDTGQAWIEFGN